MKEMMKAIVSMEQGGIDKLCFEEMPVPKISADEVLVEVKAAALNHLDLWVRGGLPGFKLQMPHIFGSDAAGVVAAVGDVVENSKVGDEVLLAPAGGAEPVTTVSAAMTTHARPPDVRRDHAGYLC